MISLHTVLFSLPTNCIPMSTLATSSYFNYFIYLYFVIKNLKVTSRVIHKLYTFFYSRTEVIKNWIGKQKQYTGTDIKIRGNENVEKFEIMTVIYYNEKQFQILLIIRCLQTLKTGNNKKSNANNRITLKRSIELCAFISIDRCWWRRWDFIVLALLSTSLLPSSLFCALYSRPFLFINPSSVKSSLPDKLLFCLKGINS